MKKGYEWKLRHAFDKEAEFRRLSNEAGLKLALRDAERERVRREKVEQMLEFATSLECRTSRQAAAKMGISRHCLNARVLALFGSARWPPTQQ